MEDGLGSAEMVWRTACPQRWRIFHKIKVRQTKGRNSMQTVPLRIRGQANFLLRGLNFKQSKFKLSKYVVFDDLTKIFKIVPLSGRSNLALRSV
jgi:hypothetical protein